MSFIDFTVTNSNFLISFKNKYITITEIHKTSATNSFKKIKINKVNPNWVYCT